MTRKSRNNRRHRVTEALQRNEPCTPTNPIETVLFAAELGDVPEIDLHKLDAHDAVTAADYFIDRQFVANAGTVKIIHGRGKQILRNAIHHFLARDRVRIAGFRDSQAPGQQGGVTVIALHSSR